jgi:membrane protein DedA with SNARE-associated domain
VIHQLLEALGRFVMSVELSTGYLGLIILMGIESACIPLPSEVIMPFAGTLVLGGHMNLWLAGLFGAIGCNVGSVVAYEIGARWGRAGVERYGKFVLLSRHDLEIADRWFAKRGDIAVFAARLLPVVRTFIALPAGIARMPRVKFHVYTFLGSLPWCLALAYAGVKLGENWEATLKPLFHKADAVLGVLIVVGIIWFVRGRLRRRSSSPVASL